MIERSETLAELFKALSKAQGQIKPAIKDKKNPHLNSKYADLGGVWEACREALSGNGLNLQQWPVTREGVSGITLMTVLGHESGEYMMAAYTMPAGKGDAQGYGSALTYARRYALAAVLGIVADDDDDGHAASAPRPAQQPRQPAPRPSAAPAPAPAPAKPPSGPTISAGQAQTLHKRLGAILAGTDWHGMDKEFAGDVLGFKVGSFTDLTVSEAKRIQDAAETVPKAEPQEGAA